MINNSEIFYQGVKLIKKSFLVMLIFCFSTVLAQELVLQQDVDGYTGCDDSYIDHSDFGPFNDINHGDKDSIRTDVCYT